MDSFSPSSNCLHRNALVRTDLGAYLLRWLNSFSYSAIDKFLCFIFRNCFHLVSLYISGTYLALNSWTKTLMVWNLEASDSSTLASTNHKHCLAIEKLHMPLFDREGISPPLLFFTIFLTRIQLYRTLPCLTHGIPQPHVFLSCLLGLWELSIFPIPEPCPKIFSTRLHLARLGHDSHF